MRFIHSVSRKVLLGASLALALGAFSFAQAAPAMAAPRVNLSTGVSCSSRNGVQTLKLSAKATASGGVVLDRLVIDIDPISGDDPAEFDSTTDFDEQVVVNGIAPGTYAIVILVEATGASDVTRSGTATIAPGKCSVKIG